MWGPGGHWRTRGHGFRDHFQFETAIDRTDAPPFGGPQTIRIGGPNVFERGRYGSHRGPLTECSPAADGVTVTHPWDIQLAVRMSKSCAEWSGIGLWTVLMLTGCASGRSMRRVPRPMRTWCEIGWLGPAKSGQYRPITCNT